MLVFWTVLTYAVTMDVDQVRNLYHKKGLSAEEVGEHLGKTVWQVIKFMKKHQIPRRKTEETKRLQFQRKPLSYKKKTRMTSSERELYEVGLVLYWGEGAKNFSTVDLANSDHEMVLIFLEMLRKIYRVDENRLRVLLYCYANQDVSALIDFWSKKLLIPKKQFIKPYVRSDFDHTRTSKMPYGLAHIRYNDKRLLEQILRDIDIIKNRLLGYRSGQTDVTVNHAA